MAAGGGVAVALPQDRGLAAAAGVLPWLALAALHVRTAVRRAGPLLFWTRDDTVGVVAAGYALVAAGALVVSRAGLRLFDLREPLVELTAVHYLFAGTGALVLAGTARGPRWAVRTAVVLTGAAPPIVALGFVTRHAVLQVGGAGLMALGVWCTAGLQLHEVATGRGRVAAGRRVRGVATGRGWVAAGRRVRGVATGRGRVAAGRRVHGVATGPGQPAGWQPYGVVAGGGRPGGGRVLLAVSGLAVWVPMVLAVAWAAGQHGDVPHVAVADMVPLHGMPNAVGFTAGGLVARHRSGRLRVGRDEGVGGCG
jgi:hypothetical protein